MRQWGWGGVWGHDREVGLWGLLRKSRYQTTRLSDASRTCYAAAPADRAVKQRKRNIAVFVSRSPNLLYHDDELINTLYQNGLEMAKVVIVNYARSGR